MQMEYHLKPFRAAIAAGTSQTPYPLRDAQFQHRLGGEGFAFSEGVITELLRNELGFDGIVCTDWGLISDSVIMGQPIGARAWGVEHLSELDGAQKVIDAGCDQFGGESGPAVVELVRSEQVSQARIDQSVRRLLRGEVCARVVRPALPQRRLGGWPPSVAQTSWLRARPHSGPRSCGSTAADSGAAALPVGSDHAVYIENIDPIAGGLGWAGWSRSRLTPILAVVRLNAPFEPRAGGLESFLVAGGTVEKRSDHHYLRAGADDHQCSSWTARRWSRSRPRRGRPASQVRGPMR